MNIAVNGRFDSRPIRGVDRYAAAVTMRLGPRVRIIRSSRPLNGVRGHLWEQLNLPLRLSGSELLWSPANSGPVAVSRQVVTIHDAAVLEHPEWFDWRFASWYRILLRLLAKRSRLILTVSEWARESLVTGLRVPRERIASIHGGVDRLVFREVDPRTVRQKYRLNSRYVLFVGSIEPRKNLIRLLDTWDHLADLADVELAICGAPAAAFATSKMRLQSDRVRLLGYVPDSDLPALYAGADCFVLPSISEGFGLPVLEAMACGTPVVCSTGGALPEIASGAALQFSPYSGQEMEQALRTVLTDKNTRDSLRERGLERAAQFSWDRTAERIWERLSGIQ